MNLVEKSHIYGESIVGDSYTKYQADCGYRVGYIECNREWEEKLHWKPVSELPNDKQLVECRIKNDIYVGTYNSYGMNILLSAFSKEKCEYVSFNIFDSWRVCSFYNAR